VGHGAQAGAGGAAGVGVQGLDRLIYGVEMAFGHAGDQDVALLARREVGAGLVFLDHQGEGFGQGFGGADEGGDRGEIAIGAWGCEVVVGGQAAQAGDQAVLVGGSMSFSLPYWWGRRGTRP